MLHLTLIITIGTIQMELCIGYPIPLTFKHHFALILLAPTRQQWIKNQLQQVKQQYMASIKIAYIATTLHFRQQIEL